MSDLNKDFKSSESRVKSFFYDINSFYAKVGGDGADLTPDGTPQEIIVPVGITGHRFWIQVQTSGVKTYDPETDLFPFVYYPKSGSAGITTNYLGIGWSKKLYPGDSLGLVEAAISTTQKIIVIVGD